MFNFNKILFSKPLDNRFLLPAVSSPQTSNTFHVLYASEAGADNISYAWGANRGYIISFTIQYVLQSAKYEVSSLSTVFDAVTAVADERAVISCARSLTTWVEEAGWCSLKYCNCKWSHSLSIIATFLNFEPWHPGMSLHFTERGDWLSCGGMSPCCLYVLSLQLNVRLNVRSLRYIQCILIVFTYYNVAP